MGYDVFISYSRKDKSFADQLLSALESKNIRCWIDYKDLDAGSNWAEEISSAIKENPGLAMVLICSASTMESRQIIKEIQLADSTDVYIIPVRIENIDLIGAYAYHLGTRNWLDAFDGDIEQIIKTVADKISVTISKYRTKKGLPPLTSEPSPLATEFTKDEQKYINKLRKFLEDGNISDIEREKLSEAAQDFEISSERAKELEELVKKELVMPERALSMLNEQKYLNKLRKVLEDKAITDDERQRLAEWMEDFDIPPTRAKELEEQVRKELGIVELTPVQEGTTAEIIAEEGSLRDIAHQFVDELNTTYENHLKAIDSKFELDPNGLKVMLDYYVGYSCKFVFDFQNESMSFSLWDWCRNDYTAPGSKDFFGEWFDNECANDFPNYEWNKRRMYGYLVFWTEDFPTDIPEAQLFNNFKKKVLTTLDGLFPKLEKKYNDSTGIISAAAKLGEFIDGIISALEKEFPHEDGWVINECDIKSLAKYAGLYIYKSDWKTEESEKGLLSFSLGSENKNFNNLYYGIVRASEDIKLPQDKSEEIYNFLSEKMGASEDPDKQWLYWRYADNDFRYTEQLPKENQKAFFEYFLNIFSKMKEGAPLIDNAIKKSSNAEPS